ncbi:hypothetical protein AURANDRAFT_70715, partial [Aureococcus anophagefferens]
GRRRRPRPRGPVRRRDHRPHRVAARGRVRGRDGLPRVLLDGRGGLRRAEEPHGGGERGALPRGRGRRAAGRRARGRARRGERGRVDGRGARRPVLRPLARVARGAGRVDLRAEVGEHDLRGARGPGHGGLPRARAPAREGPRALRRRLRPRLPPPQRRALAPRRRRRGAGRDAVHRRRAHGGAADGRARVPRQVRRGRRGAPRRARRGAPGQGGRGQGRPPRVAAHGRDAAHAQRRLPGHAGRHGGRVEERPPGQDRAAPCAAPGAAQGRDGGALRPAPVEGGRGEGAHAREERRRPPPRAVGPEEAAFRARDRHRRAPGDRGRAAPPGGARRDERAPPRGRARQGPQARVDAARGRRRRGRARRRRRRRRPAVERALHQVQEVAQRHGEHPQRHRGRRARGAAAPRLPRLPPAPAQHRRPPAAAVARVDPPRDARRRPRDHGRPRHARADAGRPVALPRVRLRLLRAQARAPRRARRRRAPRGRRQSRRRPLGALLRRQVVEPRVRRGEALLEPVGRVARHGLPRVLPLLRDDDPQDGDGDFKGPGRRVLPRDVLREARDAREHRRGGGRALAARRHGAVGPRLEPPRERERPGRARDGRPAERVAAPQARRRGHGADLDQGEPEAPAQCPRGDARDRRRGRGPHAQVGLEPDGVRRPRALAADPDAPLPRGAGAPPRGRAPHVRDGARGHDRGPRAGLRHGPRAGARGPEPAHRPARAAAVRRPAPVRVHRAHALADDVDGLRLQPVPGGPHAEQGPRGLRGLPRDRGAVPLLRALARAAALRRRDARLPPAPEGALRAGRPRPHARAHDPAPPGTRRGVAAGRRARALRRRADAVRQFDRAQRGRRRRLPRHRRRPAPGGLPAPPPALRRRALPVLRARHGLPGGLGRRGRLRGAAPEPDAHARRLRRDHAAGDAPHGACFDRLPRAAGLDPGAAAPAVARGEPRREELAPPRGRRGGPAPGRAPRHAQGLHGRPRRHPGPPRAPRARADPRARGQPLRVVAPPRGRRPHAERAALPAPRPRAPRPPRGHPLRRRAPAPRPLLQLQARRGRAAARAPLLHLLRRRPAAAPDDPGQEEARRRRRPRRPAERPRGRAREAREGRARVLRQRDPPRPEDARAAAGRAPLPQLAPLRRRVQRLRLLGLRHERARALRAPAPRRAPRREELQGRDPHRRDAGPPRARRLGRRRRVPAAPHAPLGRGGAGPRGQGEDRGGLRRRRRRRRGRRAPVVAGLRPREDVAEDRRPRAARGAVERPGHRRRHELPPRRAPPREARPRRGRRVLVGAPRRRGRRGAEEGGGGGLRRRPAGLLLRRHDRGLGARAADARAELDPLRPPERVVRVSGLLAGVPRAHGGVPRRLRGALHAGPRPRDRGGARAAHHDEARRRQVQVRGREAVDGDERAQVPPLQRPLGPAPVPAGHDSQAPGHPRRLHDEADRRRPRVARRRGEGPRQRRRLGRLLRVRPRRLDARLQGPLLPPAPQDQGRAQNHAKGGEVRSG